MADRMEPGKKEMFHPSMDESSAYRWSFRMVNVSSLTLELFAGMSPNVSVASMIWMLASALVKVALAAVIAGHVFVITAVYV